MSGKVFRNNQLFKEALCILYVPPVLTINNSPFCPHSEFICSIWISEQTAIISLHNINRLIFITEKEFAYCAVGTESLYIMQVNLSLTRVQQKRANTTNSKATVRTLPGSRLLTDARCSADLSPRSAPFIWEVSRAHISSPSSDTQTFLNTVHLLGASTLLPKLRQVWSLRMDSTAVSYRGANIFK